MNRRTYLRAAGAAGIGGLAGCLDTLGEEGEESRGGNWGDGETVLDPPSEPRGDPSHPIHGQEFPSFSLPDPLAEETVSLSDFVGERAFLMTYFFTSCPDGACPALLLRLRRAQEDAVEQGYEDDLGLLAMTFDPERDTPDVLEQYGHEQGVDFEADNWHFLRPETYEEGEQLLEDTFGMRLQRDDDADGENAGNETGDDGHDHTDNETDAGHDHGDNETDADSGNADDETGDGGHDHGEYTFTHYNLIMLVNENGVVERAYPNAVQDREEVSIETIVDDARTVATE